MTRTKHISLPNQTLTTNGGIKTNRKILPGFGGAIIRFVRLVTAERETKKKHEKITNKRKSKESP